MDDPLEQANARARRCVAELRLANRMHGIVAHELGNPLQSLVVLVELTRDEIEARSPRDPGVARLDRALESIERFRKLLVGSGRVRKTLSDRSEAELGQRRWGAVLDELLPIVSHRLARVEFHRTTAAIDDRPIGTELPSSAILGMLLGICDQLHSGRHSGIRLQLSGEIVDDRVELRLDLHAPGADLTIDPEIEDWLRDLLAEAPGCSVERRGGTITIWTPLARAGLL